MEAENIKNFTGHRKIEFWQTFMIEKRWRWRPGSGILGVHIYNLRSHVKFIECIRSVLDI